MASKLLRLYLIVLLFVSCDPEEALDPTHRLQYFVKNASKQTLYVQLEYSALTDTEKKCIYTDSIILLKSSNWSELDEIVPLFDGLVDWRVSNSNDTLYVFSADNQLLKKWLRFYDNTQGSKQFFRESDWSYRTYKKPNEKYVYHEWTFTITDDDLQ